REVALIVGPTGLGLCQALPNLKGLHEGVMRLRAPPECAIKVTHPLVRHGEITLVVGAIGFAPDPLFGRSEQSAVSIECTLRKPERQKATGFQICQRSPVHMRGWQATQDLAGESRCGH